MNKYPKRLIEVDLPIKRISAHSRREKNIRQGHPATLHVWWARRPLAACRAVACASLWPDPADKFCPSDFQTIAKAEMRRWALENLSLLSESALKRFIRISKKTTILEEPVELRKALLDFIADFANWDNASNEQFLGTSQLLTRTAHLSMGGQENTVPLIVDPFAGGGAIPLEALRVGANAFASDLNPIAVLLNRVVIEYLPTFGTALSNSIRECGKWVLDNAERELSDLYPKDQDGAQPIAYLWARQIRCEGPQCGIQIPLMRSLWLAKKGKSSIALRMIVNQKTNAVDFEIIRNANRGSISSGTIAKGSALCPRCGYTTPSKSIRKQMIAANGGSASAKLVAVRYNDQQTAKRDYRLPTKVDINAANLAVEQLEIMRNKHKGPLSLVPDELVNTKPHSVNRLPMYGMKTWGSVFTPRQSLAIATFSSYVSRLDECPTYQGPLELLKAVKVCLSLAVDRLIDFNSSLCVLNSVGGRGVVHTFGRQALPMVWDFMETNPFNEIGANWMAGINAFCNTIESTRLPNSDSISRTASATSHPLPDNSAQLVFTDPPYYDMISYADLSDFFYVWLRRTLYKEDLPDIEMDLSETPKNEEIIVEPTFVGNVGVKDNAFYLSQMKTAMNEARRITTPDGLCIVVFAHKSTSGWEAQLESLLASGWVVTGSWPIDTERAARVSAIGQARLGSSIHLVCRPRMSHNGHLQSEVGDWRDVLAELPVRIHNWMPRLESEGIVGADAIFACIGPALEIYSRFSSVERADGSVVNLTEYLEEVWAAVSKEALNRVFEGADAAGFEEDSRLTAIWLWTISTGTNGNKDDDSAIVKSAGYIIEYDAARKIAQGLGAHLEQLTSLVEIKSDNARLLPVSERTKYLFGKEGVESSNRKRKKKDAQIGLGFLEEMEKEEEQLSIDGSLSANLGKTVLDQLHQCMILFATGRSEAMKRLIVEEGVGRDQRFWRLAQALSALYPKNVDEKRWVDGILARKKSFGF